MGKRGPKSFAELTTIRAVRSTTRSKPSADLPPPPDHLQPATKTWWNAVLEDHELEPHQMRTLQAAAESWDRNQQAREALAQHGLTYTDDKGMIRARPEVAIERDARTSYLRALRELKLDVEPPAANRQQPPWAALK